MRLSTVVDGRLIGVSRVHGGVKFYRGAAKASRAYVERDRSRADDYYLGEGTGVAERLTATPEGVGHAGSMTGDTYEQWVAGIDVETGAKKGRLLKDEHALRFVEVTVNGPKTWSLAAALHPEISDALDAAQDGAANEIVGWVAQHAMSIPTSADVAKVLRAAEPERRPKSRPGFTAYVALCAFAGLRRGEALGVQVGDIDFLGRTLRVTRHLQRAKPADIAAAKNLVEAAGGITVVIRTPKYESERTIYLPDEVIAILSEHVRIQTPDGAPTRWLFDEDGKPWHDNLVDYRWQSTRKDADVNYKLHELRHYFASGLIATGCDVVAVQRAMGHASATTTLSTYAHLWPTAEDKTRSAAAGMVGEVLAAARLVQSRGTLPQMR
jgi:integrase